MGQIGILSLSILQRLDVLRPDPSVYLYVILKPGSKARRKLRHPLESAKGATAQPISFWGTRSLCKVKKTLLLHVA